MDDDFLLAEGAVAWSQLPLWIPVAANLPGFLAINIARALAMGLTFRPLSQTVRDTLAWDMARPPDIVREAGLTADQETRLLYAWHQRAM